MLFSDYKKSHLKYNTTQQDMFLSITSQLKDSSVWMNDKHIRLKFFEEIEQFFPTPDSFANPMFEIVTLDEIAQQCARIMFEQLKCEGEDEEPVCEENMTRYMKIVQYNQKPELKFTQKLCEDGKVKFGIYERPNELGFFLAMPILVKKQKEWHRKTLAISHTVNGIASFKENFHIMIPSYDNGWELSLSELMKTAQIVEGKSHHDSLKSRPTKNYYTKFVPCISKLLAGEKVELISEDLVDRYILHVDRVKLDCTVMPEFKAKSFKM